MLLLRKLVDRIYQHLVSVWELIPIIWMLEIWTLVRVMTIVILVVTLILQDAWEDNVDVSAILTELERLYNYLLSLTLPHTTN